MESLQNTRSAHHSDSIYTAEA